MYQTPGGTETPFPPNEAMRERPGILRDATNAQGKNGLRGMIDTGHKRANKCNIHVGNLA